jgi:hypothetical protein
MHCRVSPVPSEFQECLGGSLIAGSSSGVPIIGRTSVGPSAFSFDLDDIKRPWSKANAQISTTKLLDYSLKNPIIAPLSDLSNTSGNNTLWTHISQVYLF